MSFQSAVSSQSGCWLSGSLFFFSLCGLYNDKTCEQVHVIVPLQTDNKRAVLFHTGRRAVTELRVYYPSEAARLLAQNWNWHVYCFCPSETETA